MRTPVHDLYIYMSFNNRLAWHKTPCRHCNGRNPPQQVKRGLIAGTGTDEENMCGRRSFPDWASFGPPTPRAGPGQACLRRPTSTARCLLQHLHDAPQESFLVNLRVLSLILRPLCEP